VLIEPIVSLVKYRELIREMAIRDAREINRGSALGSTWLVLRPLIQTLAYVIIVTFVFRSRPNGSDSAFDYMLYVLCGMIPWQIVIHTLTASPSLIRNHADLVKQIVYPMETLPLRSLIVGSFSSLTTLGLYLVLAGATGRLEWSILLLPIPTVMLIILMVGVSWVFMILGAVAMDFREIVGASLNVLIFVTPVLIARTMVSPTVWTVVLLNPLTHVVVCFRDVFACQCHPLSWLIFGSMAILAIIIGAWMLTFFRLRVVEYL
jgi:lipopolysaccharide transport system permease protein